MPPAPQPARIPPRARTRSGKHTRKRQGLKVNEQTREAGQMAVRFLASIGLVASPCCSGRVSPFLAVSVARAR